MADRLLRGHGLDDFTLITDDGQEFEIVAFVDDDLFRVDADRATYVVTQDALGGKELFRLLLDGGSAAASMHVS